MSENEFPHLSVQIHEAERAGLTMRQLNEQQASNALGDEKVRELTRQQIFLLRRLQNGEDNKDIRNQIADCIVAKVNRICQIYGIHQPPQILFGYDESSPYIAWTTDSTKYIKFNSAYWLTQKPEELAVTEVHELTHVVHDRRKYAPISGAQTPMRVSYTELNQPYIGLSKARSIVIENRRQKGLAAFTSSREDQNELFIEASKITYGRNATERLAEASERIFLAGIPDILKPDGSVTQNFATSLNKF